MNITDHKLKRYLGDGVYASHDGYQAWLSVNDLGGLNFEHSIAIDRDTATSLSEWLNNVGRIMQKATTMEASLARAAGAEDRPLERRLPEQRHLMLPIRQTINGLKLIALAALIVGAVIGAVILLSGVH